MARKRQAKKDRGIGDRLARALRGEVVGIVLLVLALLTMLCLLAADGGGVSAWWVNTLRSVFGVGVWISPAVLAFIGGWLVWRRVTGGEEVRAGRPIGALLLFLVFVAVAHLVTMSPEAQGRPQGGGGGWLGWRISLLLVQAVGLAAASVILVIVALVGGFLVSGIAMDDLWDRLRERARRSQELREFGPQQLPLPGGHVPFWRRWGKRRPLRAGQAKPAQAVSGSVVARPIKTAKTSETEPGPASPGPRTKVSGTAQEWRLPVVEEILEDVSEQEISREDLRMRARVIEEALGSFGVPVKVVEANQGPAVTQFGLKPGTVERRSSDGELRRVRVKVSQIARLSNDLSLALAAAPIRIETPVPGRDVVGVEVPNTQLSLVSLGGVMASEAFRDAKGVLKVGLGRDVSGSPVVADLAGMPHLLIAGATNSGKSVCINALVTCLLCTHTPETLKLLMIDPKMVELSLFNGVPHLLTPVVIDLGRVVHVLRWATTEMDRRYRLFNRSGARHIDIYNEMLDSCGEAILPYIVVVIDELADLMMVAADEVERYICRLAQMARATGIHLVVATQRPSTDVVTGLIKANFPARIAFAVATQIDSRVILDQPGAEHLLGRGDMLVMAPDAAKLVRLQGCFVSDREVERLVQHWRGTPGPQLDAEPRDEEALGPQQMAQQPLWEDMIEMERAAQDKDELYDQAVQIVRDSNTASVSLLQRRLRIGYSRAARLIDELEENGLVGPAQPGGRGREVMPPTAAEDPR
jgi:S-DNA-T family DNA segregation ATPase FtsK/SpoIIIE